MSELSNELLRKIHRHDPKFLSKLVDDMIDLYLGYVLRGKNQETAKNLVFIELTDSLEYIAPTGRKDKTTSELKRGTQIIYVPTHANGDIHHTDCEAGFIASPTVLPGNAIFCRFWANGSVPRRLRTLANSEATPIENLVVRDTVPPQDVEAAIKILCQRAKG